MKSELNSFSINRDLDISKPNFITSAKSMGSRQRPQKEEIKDDESGKDRRRAAFRKGQNRITKNMSLMKK